MEDYSTTTVQLPDVNEVEAWAKSQKRVTNKEIRKRFDLEYEDADTVYSFLKSVGVIGSMGYVQKMTAGKDDRWTKQVTTDSERLSAASSVE